MIASAFSSPAPKRKYRIDSGNLSWHQQRAGHQFSGAIITKIKARGNPAW